MHCILRKVYAGTLAVCSGMQRHRFRCVTYLRYPLECCPSPSHDLLFLGHCLRFLWILVLFLSRCNLNRISIPVMPWFRMVSPKAGILIKHPLSSHFIDEYMSVSKSSLLVSFCPDSSLLAMLHLL